jgi:Fe-S cluster biogenesis protein NfuA
MPAWFSKVFKSAPPEAPAVSAPQPPAVAALEEEEEEGPRRVLNAPVLTDTEAPAPDGASVRVKARHEARTNAILLAVDRPVISGYSLVLPDADAAAAQSPLAATLFAEAGVASVTLHESTITVLRGPDAPDWETMARALGAAIRAHLLSGMPTVDPDLLARMPDERAVRSELQRVIDEEINPGIAGHSGYLTLNRVVGNTAYITMGGGCQGCAASSITLRGGVERSFRDAVPLLGAVLDETDHTAGENPFFTALPAGMGG